jgi:RNA polymerase sigma-70 factor (ECF subfamily)
MPDPRPYRAACARSLERLHAAALQALPFLRDALSREDFSAALERSLASRFPGARFTPEEAARYLDSLHAADLALALACTAGHELAWEHFMAHFRPDLYAAARAVAGEAGRDLADALYADLYGLKEREGRRRSLFEYFHGRSKLSTWLRAVLAQRHVDAVRSARRTVSLDEETGDSDEPARHAPPVLASRPDELASDRTRFLALLQAAMTAAIAGLDPRDRLRLCYYYVQDLTLAEIGRLLGEHEATVSRKLDRARRDLRAAVERILREEKKLSEAQARLCFEYATQEWPFDLTRALSQRE